MMLTAFTAGLLLITVSELGDKTFCIALLLATRHSRRLVFIGVMAALSAMTILSVLMGQAIAFLPKLYIWYAEIALFIGFGLKLLYDAYQMPAYAACEEMAAAKQTVEQARFGSIQVHPNIAIVGQAFLLTFVAEWGDRTQFATMALAASHHAVGVTLGAILGHAICTAIAVLGGRLVAGRISERVLTALGGILFLIFGMIAAVQGK